MVVSQPLPSENTFNLKGQTRIVNGTEYFDLPTILSPIVDFKETQSTFFRIIVQKHDAEILHLRHNSLTGVIVYRQIENPEITFWESNFALDFSEVMEESYLIARFLTILNNQPDVSEKRDWVSDADQKLQYKNFGKLSFDQCETICRLKDGYIPNSTQNILKALNYNSCEPCEQHVPYTLCPEGFCPKNIDSTMIWANPLVQILDYSEESCRHSYQVSLYNELTDKYELFWNSKTMWGKYLQDTMDRGTLFPPVCQIYYKKNDRTYNLLQNMPSKEKALTTIGNFKRCQYVWYEYSDTKQVGQYHLYKPNNIHFSFDSRECYIWAEISGSLNLSPCFCFKEHILTDKQMLRNELSLILHQILNSDIINPHLIFSETLSRIIVQDDDSMQSTLQSNRELQRLLTAAAPLLKTLSSHFFEEILSQVKESSGHLVNTSRIVTGSQGDRSHASTVLESDLFLKSAPLSYSWITMDYLQIVINKTSIDLLKGIIDHPTFANLNHALSIARTTLSYALHVKELSHEDLFLILPPISQDRIRAAGLSSNISFHTPSLVTYHKRRTLIQTDLFVPLSNARSEHQWYQFRSLPLYYGYDYFLVWDTISNFSMTHDAITVTGEAVKPETYPCINYLLTPKYTEMNPCLYKTVLLPTVSVIIEASFFRIVMITGRRRFRLRCGDRASTRLVTSFDVNLMLLSDFCTLLAVDQDKSVNLKHRTNDKDQILAQGMILIAQYDLTFDWSHSYVSELVLQIAVGIIGFTSIITIASLIYFENLRLYLFTLTNRQQEAPNDIPMSDGSDSSSDQDTLKRTSVQDEPMLDVGQQDTRPAYHSVAHPTPPPHAPLSMGCHSSTKLAEEILRYDLKRLRKVGDTCSPTYENLRQLDCDLSVIATLPDTVTQKNMSSVTIADPIGHAQMGCFAIPDSLIPDSLDQENMSSLIPDALRQRNMGTLGNMDVRRQRAKSLVKPMILRGDDAIHLPTPRRCPASSPPQAKFLHSPAPLVLTKENYF